MFTRPGRPICPSCGSGSIIINKSGSAYCRRCNHKWDVEQKKEE